MGHGIAPGLPECPSHLSVKAREYWEAFVEALGPCGLLEKVDQGALSQLCEAYAMRAVAYEQQDLKAWRCASDVYARMACEFGMTPSSRAKVHPTNKNEPDELEAFTKQA